MKNLLFLMAIVMGSQASLANDSFFKWCEDSALYLKQALIAGSKTTDFTEEEIVLSNAIKEVLKGPPNKTEKYFRYTLLAAQVDVELWPEDVERRVQVLRFYITESIRDLDFIFHNQLSSDAGPYVKLLISRGLTLGYRSNLSKVELVLLTRTVQRGMFWLEKSDFRRTFPYSCAHETLRLALHNSQDGSLGIETRISLLRIGLRQARVYLSSSKGCH